MIKRIASFVLASAVNAYEQEGHSADIIDETRIHYCVFNDFDNKEQHSIDLGFEGLAEPRTILSIYP